MIRTSQTNDIRENIKFRSSIYVSVIVFLFIVIIARLFYWQVVQSANLQAEAEDQYRRSLVKTGSRGFIFTEDGKPLVTNKQVYRVFAQPYAMIDEPQTVATTLADILVKDLHSFQTASGEAERNLVKEQFKNSLLEKLSNKDSKWASLATNISETTKEEVAAHHFSTVGFDPYEVRDYPEASMAAQLTGFVGKNEEGQDTGYFGVEGGLDQELKGRELNTTILTDALGQQLTAEQRNQANNLDGRDITLTIRRDLQNIAERQLKKGLQRYGGQSGEVVIMDPETGKILALASLPSYDQANFFEYDPSLYQNPSLSSLYEPGSTFKVLTVAAGLNEGVISPNTQCDTCAGPRVFGKYTIRTWNDSYTPNITMTDALAQSNNVAMIFIAEKVGADKLKKYLQDFGIGQSIHIDLQGDVDTPFPKQWGPVELATISFGQGISTTSLQLIRAVGAIANHGLMMRPLIVEGVKDRSTGEFTKSEIIEEKQVITPETAKTLTSMMIESARHGEAQWTASPNHEIAGKTGTSQVPAGGKYSEDQTIASFIGFAPPDNPRFVMLVKIVGPTSSIWAAETAAPLWYSIADELYLALGIPPDRQPGQQ